MNREDAQILADKYRQKMLGSTYRHFKGNFYIVVDIGVHSETAELQVIYRPMCDLNKIWIRPLDMFLSPVDKTKYPDATQEERFKKVV